MDPQERSKPEMTMEEILALLEERQDVIVEVAFEKPEVENV